MSEVVSPLETVVLPNPLPDTNAPVEIISIDGQVYLGKLHVSEGVITVTDALAFGTPSAINKNHLIAYIEAVMMATLQKPIVIGGAGVSYSRSELSDDLALEFSILMLRLKQAEKMAPRQLVTAEFLKLTKGE